MTSPDALRTLSWLLRDTVRQALDSRIFWVMFLVSCLCIFFCLSIDTSTLPTDVPERILPSDPKWQSLNPFEREKSGVEAVEGEISFLFGATRVHWNLPREETVRWLQLLLAGVIADTLGVLLALLWTADFLPVFLDPSLASVLFTKPVPRWSLLLSKYFGVVGFVAFQALFFIGGTWLALGVRSGIWEPRYLLCIPLLLIHFAIFYSFSALLAVCFRGALAAICGSFGFWFLCWHINFARHKAVLADMQGVTRGGLEVAYWLLPKPTDLGWLLVEALDAKTLLPQIPELHALREQGALSPELTLFSGLVFAVTVLILAGWRLTRSEY